MHKRNAWHSVTVDPVYICIAVCSLVLPCADLRTGFCYQEVDMANHIKSVLKMRGEMAKVQQG